MQEISENIPLRARIPSWLRLSSWARKVDKPPSILPVSSDAGSGKGEEATETPFCRLDAVNSSDMASSFKTQAHGALSDGALDDEKHANEKKQQQQRHVAYRFHKTTLAILLRHRYLNALLLLAPAGIAVHWLHLNPVIVFVINAIAILPLAGLLTLATESLAKRCGNTLGALVNVTFGNTIELIIFIIALSKNELRIVQASLIGSILANLLCIFGMSLAVGGAWYKEQVYNSTVSQMSAVLLGLCVLTLLLPTAFYNAFKQTEVQQANKAMLKFSRGTSVILLVVYALYLVFQLITHKHLYVGTPQHVLDEEALPGPVADWFGSSPHSSSSDSDSDSDSDATSGSEGTAARFKRVIKRGGKRKTSNGSSSNGSSTVNPSNNHANDLPSSSPESYLPVHVHETSVQGEAQVGGSSPTSCRTVSFGTKMTKLDRKECQRQKKGKRKEKKERRRAARKTRELLQLYEQAEKARNEAGNNLRASNRPLIGRTAEVHFVVPATRKSQGVQIDGSEPVKSRVSAFDIRPALPRNYSTGLWQPTPETTLRPPRSGLPSHTPRIYGVHRSGSLPPNNFPRQPRISNELTRTSSSRSHAPTLAYPPYTEHLSKEEAGDSDLSRTSAGLLLVVSTTVVALCANGLVASIEEVTKSGGFLPETFVGLIIIPLVGNAAEHFTAVRMAMQNKMDLTIGIAVGSSIQIALFITPAVVLIAWAMDKSLSLYFTLFETVSLFASAFIVNFLILDGKSNYLEGVIMFAAYVIIALAAWLYPPVDDLSLLG